MTGKIANLPPLIREQLNERLRAGEDGRTLLPWLNSLPEVQAVLKAEFERLAISPQNLSDHRSHGFLDWKARQEAVEFASSLNADDCALQQILPTDLAEKLSRWLSVRYAAATRALSNAHPDDLDKELRHLRNFSLVILALRRGEVSAGRLALEQQRLKLELGDTAQEKEREFWEWTKRADIQAKLYPNRDPDQIRRDVVAMLDRELLGVRPIDEPEETADPAILI